MHTQQNPRPLSRVSLGALASLALTALLSHSAGAATLQGTAAYRERIALVPDAVFEVELQDLSRADAPAIVLGRSTLNPAGQPPYNFLISYDESAIQARHRYGVRATIKSADGKLLFTTDRSYPVFNANTAPLHLLLVSARHSEKPPVSTPLNGTYWKLISLNGAPVKVFEKQREANLLFTANGQRVSGNGGCNKFAGSYLLDGDKLVFGQMAASMRACLDGMEQEKHYFDALAQVGSHRIRGERLELLDADGKVRAEFKAVYLK